MRVANLITETLVRAGVTRIFSLSGNQIMPIYDACLDSGIPIVHVRHESAAVFMADAWSQMTGETGVALVTAGAGFTNALGAMYSVVCSESPVLLLSGDSPLKQDGNGAFQELDQVSMSSTVTKSSIRFSAAAQVPDELARIIQTARSGRPGPVHVAVPFDLVNEDTDIAPSVLSEIQFTEPTDQAAHARVADLVGKIKQRVTDAERPVLVTGPAFNGYRAAARDEITQLAALLPVIPMESPRGFRDPALGNISAVFKEADVVVLLGKAVDFTMTFASEKNFADGVEFMVIDPDVAVCEQARRTLGARALLVEQENTLDVLQHLSTALDSTAQSWRDWNQRVVAALNQRCATPVSLSAEAGEADGIHPAVLCQLVQEFLDTSDRAVAICDGGEFGQWSQAGIAVPMRIINGVSGGIGAGPCYGIAAKMSEPASTVVVFVGDGTVGFHLAEFETAVRMKVPVIVIVGHDARWNAEVEIQRRDYGEDRLIGCELDDTRYDLVVAAMGGHGEYVERSAELPIALERAVNSKKPACINVRLNGQPAPTLV